MREKVKTDEQCLVERLILSDEQAWSCVLRDIIRPYVLSIRKKIYGTQLQNDVSPDAVASRVYMSLLRDNASALRRFRFDCRLSTFLYYWIKDALHSEFRLAEGSLGDRLNPLQPDSAISNENPFRDSILRERITEAENCLHHLYKEHPIHFCVLAYRTILCKSSKETAVLTRHTVAWVDQMLHRAQRYMRSYREQPDKGDSGPLCLLNRQTSYHSNTNLYESIRKNTVIPEQIFHLCTLLIPYSDNQHHNRRTSEVQYFMSTETAKATILREAEIVRENKNYSGLLISLKAIDSAQNCLFIRELLEWAENGKITVPFMFIVSGEHSPGDKEKNRWIEPYPGKNVVGLAGESKNETGNSSRRECATIPTVASFCGRLSLSPLLIAITTQTLPNLAAWVMRLQRRGYLPEVTLAHGIEWTEHDVRNFEEQLDILTEFYLHEADLIPIKLLSTRHDIRSTAEMRLLSQIGPMKDNANSNSDKEMRHMVADSTLPEIRENVSHSFSCSSPTDEVCDDRGCKECVLRLFCSNLTELNHSHKETGFPYDVCRCVMMLALARKSAEYQIKKIIPLSGEQNSHETGFAEAALKAYFVLHQLPSKVPPFTTER